MNLRIVPDKLDGDAAFSVYADAAYCGRVSPEDLAAKVAELSKRASFEDDPEVTKRDVAAAFKVHPRTVNGWITQGLPHIRHSSRILRFELGACRAWLRHKGLIREHDKANS